MESMGHRFKAAREKKRMSISQAAAQTRIKVQILEWMEQDDFTRMPAPAYAKGFIRMYATFLNLDPVPLVQEYLDLHAGKKAPPKKVAESAANKPVLPWLIKKQRPASAAQQTPAPEPEKEPAAIPETSVEKPAPQAVPAPQKPAPQHFKKPDFSALFRAVAAWPWRQMGMALALVFVVILMIKGLARCASRAEAPPVLSRPLEFKKGVPAVLMDPPEPYLPVPAEPAEKKP